MERDYLFGAAGVLIVVTVIVLIFYGFSSDTFADIKSIADEVFKVSEKQAEQAKVIKEEADAKNALAAIAAFYMDSAKIESVECSLDFNEIEFSEKFEIRLVHLGDKDYLQLVEIATGKVLDAKLLGKVAEGCVMKNKDTSGKLSKSQFTYGNGIRLNGERFARGLKAYKTKAKELCFVTEKSSDIKFFQGLKNCATSKVVVSDEMMQFLKNLMSELNACSKLPADKGYCRCSEVNMGSLEDGYAIKIVPDAAGNTAFSLDYDNSQLSSETVSGFKVGELNLRSEPGSGFNEYMPLLWSKEQKMSLTDGRRYLVRSAGKEILFALPLVSKELPFCVSGFDAKQGKEGYKEKFVEFLSRKNNKKGMEYFDLMYDISQKYNVDFFLVVSIIQKESNWDKDAVGAAGEAGLMQLMPGTARDLGLDVPSYKKNECVSGNKEGCSKAKDERFDPRKNIDAGVRYLSMVNKGKIVAAIAAYNAGPGAVNRWMNEGWDGYDINGVKIETTRAYVEDVCSTYASVSAAGCTT